MWRRVGPFEERENLVIPSTFLVLPWEREKKPMLPIAEDEERERVQGWKRREGRRKREACLCVVRETEDGERYETVPSPSNERTRKSVIAEEGWMRISRESYLDVTEKERKNRDRMEHSSWRIEATWDCMEGGDRRRRKRSVCGAFWRIAIKDCSSEWGKENGERRTGMRSHSTPFNTFISSF